MASVRERAGRARLEVSFERGGDEKLVYLTLNGKLIAFWKVVFSQMRTTQRKKKHCPPMGAEPSRTIAVCFSESDGH